MRGLRRCYCPERFLERRLWRVKDVIRGRNEEGTRQERSGKKGCSQEGCAKERTCQEDSRQEGSWSKEGSRQGGRSDGGCTGEAENAWGE